MMFKKSKIKKLLVDIAKLQAEIGILDQIIKNNGTVSGYYICELIEKTGELAAAKKQLQLIYGEANEIDL